MSAWISLLKAEGRRDESSATVALKEEERMAQGKRHNLMLNPTFHVQMAQKSGFQTSLELSDTRWSPTDRAKNVLGSTGTRSKANSSNV